MRTTNLCPHCSGDVLDVAGEAAAVEGAIAGRRSIRSFGPEPVAEAELRGILAAACWAPSPHNSQPWRFVAVVSEAARRQLADRMAERWAADLRADGVAAAAIRARVERRRERIATAPLGIVVCVTREGLDAYPDGARQRAEWATAMQSLGAAVQNLLLAAHARGLGTCWMCAPVFCPDVVQGALDLDPGWEPQVLVLVGYPAQQPEPKPRRGAAELTIFK